jgi:hypothetical protein
MRRFARAAFGCCQKERLLAISETYRHERPTRGGAPDLELGGRIFIKGKVQGGSNMTGTDFFQTIIAKHCSNSQTALNRF